MKLEGSILWLTDDPQTLRSQIEGARLSVDPISPPALHYGVNTDAIISGAACTLGYTGEILGPYFLENFKEVIHKNDIQNGTFQVVVGGEAYGSGSSREVAVVAHQGAGIRLVIAQSFQRIFQENMVYAGLPFSTDFTLLKRLLAGEDIDLSSLAKALPPFFAAVAEHQGLMQYGTALLNGKIEPTYTTDPTPRPMTCIEKIVAANAWVGNQGNQQKLGLASVSPSDQVLCRAAFRGMHEYTGGMVMDLYEKEWGQAPLFDPENVAAFEDHFVLLDHDTVPLTVKSKRLQPANKLRDEMIDACERYNIRLHGPNRPLQGGVCHRIVVEDYAEPGSIVCLTDSHSPTAGVLNTFAFGVGSTAMAFALRTGLIPVTVPKTVRVWVEGEAGDVLSPKDLILHLIGDPYFREEQWRETATDTCVIQFGGPGLEQWNVDELSVLTNMTVEGGLMTGIVEPNASLAAFLKTNRGQDYQERFVYPDAQAEYTKVINIHLAEVPLSIATPGDSRNRAPLDQSLDVAIQNVVIASCTGGSLADLRAAAQVLKGKALHPNVRLTVSPSSDTVADTAEKEGLLQIFRKAGAVISQPGCGSCIGNGPGIPLEGETTASTTNRNFDRRMGAPGPVYLVSPAVAAAAAITGKLTDPRTLS